MIVGDIYKAFSIIHGLPYFWTTMMYSSLIAIFSGALIYDGDVPHAKKGVFSVLSYIIMILFVTIGYAVQRYPFIKSDVAYQIFIYPAQLTYISIFWAIGFIGAILVFRKFIHRRKII
jgi:hypothetical protein